MPEFTLKVLGPPRVETADGSPVEKLSPSSAALLTYLSLQRKPVARDHLASLFWPRAEMSKARHSLRQRLSRIMAMDLETGDSRHVSDMPGREDNCQWHPSAPGVMGRG